MKKLMSFKFDDITRQRIDIIVEKLNEPKEGEFWGTRKTKTDAITNAIARYYLDLTTPAPSPASSSPATTTPAKRKRTSSAKKAKGAKK